MPRQRSVVRVVLLLFGLAALFAGGILAGRWLLARVSPEPMIMRPSPGASPTAMAEDTDTPAPPATQRPTATAAALAPRPTATPPPSVAPSPTPMAEMSDIVSGPTPSPTAAPATAAPPAAPAEAPAPEPQGPLPAPVLLEPADGENRSRFTGEQIVTLKWQWSGTLAKDQWFDIMLKQNGQMAYRHSKDSRVRLEGPPLGHGPYEWWVQIAVFEGDPDAGGVFRAHVSQPSAHWRFRWESPAQPDDQERPVVTSAARLASPPSGGALRLWAVATLLAVGACVLASGKPNRLE